MTFIEAFYRPYPEQVHSCLHNEIFHRTIEDLEYLKLFPHWTPEQTYAKHRLSTRGRRPHVFQVLRRTKEGKIQRFFGSQPENFE